MKLAIVAATILLATDAAAQTTTCFQTGRVTECNTVQPPSDQQMQDSMGQFGAALGDALRRRKEKKLQQAAEEQLKVCAAPEGPITTNSRAYYVCVGVAALRLEPSGADPTVIAEAARSQCATERRGITAALSTCGAMDFSDFVEQTARGSALNAILQVRAQRATH